MLKMQCLVCFFGLSFGGGEFAGASNLLLCLVLSLFVFVCLFVCWLVGFCWFLLVHWFVRSFVCLFFEVLQGFVGCGVVVFGRDGIYLHMYFPKNP